MSTATTTKFQLGTAALAVAAAAVTPVMAQADTMAPAAPALSSIAQALGSGAGADWLLQGDKASNQEAAQGTPWSELFFIGIKAASDVPPGLFTPDGLVFSFNPGAVLPFFGDIWAGLLNPYNGLEVCVLGATLRLGPYGTTQGLLTQGC